MVSGVIQGRAIEPVLVVKYTDFLIKKVKKQNNSTKTFADDHKLASDFSIIATAKEQDTILKVRTRSIEMKISQCIEKSDASLRGPLVIRYLLMNLMMSNFYQRRVL